MTRPKVLVIGSQGQVARSLADVLPARGIELIVAARPELDLTRPETIAAVIAREQPRFVINPAAYTAVDRAEDEPDLAFAINESAAGVIAAAAAKIGAPVIHLSTDYVFGGDKTTPYRETDPTAPLGVYGASKLAGEHAVAAANAQHVILRTAWVCSPYGANFVKTMLRLAADRPHLRVVDDQTGAPTFASVIADTIADIVLTLSKPPAATDAHYGIFHLANAGETTWCRFARAIMDSSAQRGGPSVPVEAITTADYPTKARRPAYSGLSTAKLSATYGFNLPPWQDSLGPCLDALIGPPRPVV